MADSVPDSPTALGDLRVLDLAGPPALYCTKLLADLGADVIRIAPPAGDPLGDLGPFIAGAAGQARGVPDLYFNPGKRSVALDIARPEGAALFRRLAAGADVIVESFAPGYLDGLGLGYDDLRGANPGLIVAAVTPFGQSGPYAQYQGSDLVGVAMGGLLWINGLPEAPPYRPAGEQAFMQAGLAACAGILVALAGRDASGVGDFVDISVQEAVALTTLQSANANYLTFAGRVPGRGSTVGQGARATFRCRDGRWVSFTVPPHRWQALVDWLQESGMAGGLTDARWEDQRYRGEHYDEVAAACAAFLAGMDAAEAFREGQARGLLCLPVNEIADLLEDEALIQQEFFTTVAQADLGRSLIVPGAPYHHAATPWRIGGPAPLPGEHTYAVLGGELGLSPDELARLARAGVIAGQADEDGG